MKRRGPSPALLLILPLVTLLAACGELGTGPDPTGPVEEITELPRQLSVSEEEVIRASNRFGFDLAGRISHPDSNFFVSPLSASMALGMALNGADGETYTQMREVLGFGDLPLDEINASYRGLLDLLVELDPTVETAIGNSVWIRDGFPVEPDFTDRVRSWFDAEVARLDFSDPGASATINGWVSDATRGRIETIVPDGIPGDIVLYLINAVYFNGTWTFKFDPADTREAPFELRGGTTAPIDLMALEGTLSYQATERFQAVDLPYGGRAYSMTVLLPRDGVGVEELVAWLDAEAWVALAGGFREKEGTLHLPRFRMEWKRKLNEDLKAMGMTHAFDGRADFSRMTPAGVEISEVLQKSFVRVDERGTEAAAVTKVGFRVISQAGPFTMRVDRPFLFAIRERHSGTVLFLGKMVRPPEDT